MAKTFLLVGSGSGIGLATAEHLLGDGHEVLGAVRDPSKLDDLSGIEVVDGALQEGGPEPALPSRLDGMVYFPGTIRLKPFQQCREEDFQEDLEVNLLGAVRWLKLAMPSLRQAAPSSVVLFSTVAVGTGMPYHASIAAAKGAVEALARTLAAEWAPRIRVNCIAPSLTETKLAAPLLDSDAKREAAQERHPLKQIGNPSDVAQLVGYLLSDASQFMTGQVLRPDGGLSAVKTFS